MIVERRNPARVAEVSSKPYAWNAVAAAFTRPSSRPARRSNETSREEEVGSVSSPARDVSFAAASRLRALVPRDVLEDEGEGHEGDEHAHGGELGGGGRRVGLVDEPERGVVRRPKQRDEEERRARSKRRSALGVRTLGRIARRRVRYRDDLDLARRWRSARAVRRLHVTASGRPARPSAAAPRGGAPRRCERDAKLPSGRRAVHPCVPRRPGRRSRGETPARARERARSERNIQPRPPSTARASRPTADVRPRWHRTVRVWRLKGVTEWCVVARCRASSAAQGAMWQRPEQGTTSARSVGRNDKESVAESLV